MNHHFPIRMRASLDGDTALVKALLTHPMETGLGKDAEGQPRPAHFITEVDLLLNGVPVARVWTGTGISADPLFGWRVTGVRPGDKIGVAWRDNQGQQHSFETTAQ
jgi:sulfur-oxidizing protein SoxZ